MKTISNTLTKAILLFAGIFMSLVCLAQDKPADIKVDINTHKGNDWYAQPWVWVVGGAVFVLLLVALLKNNRARE